MSRSVRRPGAERAAPRAGRPHTEDAGRTPAVREAVVSKTVKLPLSLDDRLRRHCLASRRTGQDVMHDAIRAFLDRADQAGAA